MNEAERITDYLDKIDKMMIFLRIGNFDVPAYNLELPVEANGSRYRSEKRFRYHKATRAITYNGWNIDWHSLAGPKNDNIEIHGIGPTLPIAKRIYSFLMSECLSGIRKRTAKSVIENVVDLVLWFNDLEFIIDGA